MSEEIETGTDKTVPSSKDRSPIPYGRQSVTEADIKAVTETLNSVYLTQGPKIQEFEEAFAEYVGSKFAVAVANGTAALHLSTMAMGVTEGDKVITTPITFAATANCVRYCGGEVVFADINPETYLLDVNKVRELLESSPKGTYKGIIPVDFAGRAVNLEEFREIADEYNLWIIEDACHAPGGYFKDSNGTKQLCGNGKFADLAIFSFHPVKHIAAGEGGMITTNNEELYQRLLKLRTHGITKDEDEYVNPVEFAIGAYSPLDRPMQEAEKPKTQNSKLKTQNYPPWYMEMQELGYNYRLTDIQAALGLSQLRRAEEGLERRREIAKRYAEAFDEKSFIKNQSGIVEGHAYHLYVIEAKDRLGLYNHLRDHQIYSQIHYIPLHVMPYYQKFGWGMGNFPNAEEYYSGCISLPVYPALLHKEQEFVIDCINRFYEQ